MFEISGINNYHSKYGSETLKTINEADTTSYLKRKEEHDKYVKQESSENKKSIPLLGKIAIAGASVFALIKGRKGISKIFSKAGNFIKTKFPKLKGKLSNFKAKLPSLKGKLPNVKGKMSKLSNKLPKDKIKNFGSKVLTKLKSPINFIKKIFTKKA